MKADAVYLTHMLEAVNHIQDFVEDADEEAFKNDKKTQDAVIRELEIIGEAAKLISDGGKKDIDLPWNKIVGMRDKLIHGYFGVDLDVVWETVQKDLPRLKAAVEKTLQT